MMTPGVAGGVGNYAGLGEPRRGDTKKKYRRLRGSKTIFTLLTPGFTRGHNRTAPLGASLPIE